MNYQQCTRCVMDNKVDKDIRFDESGLCNHCRRYDTIVDSRRLTGDEAQSQLNKVVSNIKKAGKNREYDCLIGVSGGVDSTYVAYLVKKLGLRPLAVHFDNGWDSELAVKNIENTLKKLDIDLITYVIDWEEFRELQVAFLKASTPDGEIPTDHAIFALLWREASKRGIRHIISGMNFSTEALNVSSWSYGHSDWRYIKGLQKTFGKSKLKHYPHFGFSFLFYVNFVKRIRSISILNYIEYDKDEVKKVLIDELGWKDYGGKHYESIYTRFYHGYILPKKFGIDKRYGHFSSLINSGLATREEALEALKQPTYDEQLQKDDREYVIKKLRLSEQEFDAIMNDAPRNFGDYKNSYFIVKYLRAFVRYLRSKNLYPK